MENKPGSGWKPVNVPSTPDTSTKADWVKSLEQAELWELIQKRNATGELVARPAEFFSMIRDCIGRFDPEAPLIVVEYIGTFDLPVEDKYFLLYAIARQIFVECTREGSWTEWERLLFSQLEKERRKLEALGVKELLTIKPPEQKAEQTKPSKEQQDVIGLVGTDGLTKNQLVLLFHLFLQRYETAPKNTRTRIVAQFLHLLTRKPWNSSTSDFKKLVSRGTEAKDVNTSIKDLDRVKGLFEKYKLKDLAEAAEQEKGKVLKGQEGT